MTVILTSPVEGKQTGEEYTGPNEAFLLQEGYAKPTTPRSGDPKFLDKPRHLEYEHDEDAEAELIRSPEPNPLVQNGPVPVAPETAVQTGHPEDPLNESDEDELVPEVEEDQPVDHEHDEPSDGDEADLDLDAVQEDPHADADKDPKNA